MKKEIMKKEILKIEKIPTRDLRELNGEVLKDYIICIKDNVSIGSWVEDIYEAPEDYDYTPDEVMHFVNLLNK